MALREPPQVLRIKRRREDDPLQALVFEESKRRLKRPRFVFKLQRTEENDIQDSTTVLQSEKRNAKERPVFNLPSSSHSDIQGSQTKPLEDVPSELNPDLLDMLNDYLKNNDETKPTGTVKPPKRRQSSISQNSVDGSGRPHLDIPKTTMLDNNAIAEDNEEQGNIIGGAGISEYVYDVYYRDKAVGDQFKAENIGYIRFDDDEMDMIEEDDFAPTDDEDSNDENFYRNDYPDDEDGGYESEAVSLGLDEPSDDQDDEFDILTNRRRFSRLDFERNEGVVGLGKVDQLEADVMERGITEKDEDGDVDMEVDDEPENAGKRHNFFPNEENDSMAIHRDRIFNKLQDMIDN